VECVLREGLERRVAEEVDERTAAQQHGTTHHTFLYRVHMHACSPA
jgi:hypothetical protein